MPTYVEIYEYHPLIVVHSPIYFSTSLNFHSKVETYYFFALAAKYSNNILTGYLSLRNNKQSPSSKTLAAAASVSYHKSQAKHHPILYDRRIPINKGVNRSTITLPTSLYHPVFQQWRVQAADRNLEVPDTVIAGSSNSKAHGCRFHPISKREQL
ncbi:hypothetical protein BYT27DRAFT_7255297 [Phlegmacium glaucopus]|nr:hypothetical protein BYT27DRAFT_7255297 [Phlegmacium glaucopus]